MAAATLSFDVNNVNKIVSVTDGAGRVFPFVYDASGNLGSIADPAGRKTIYTYTTGLLTKITYPDGKFTVFTYEQNNNMASAVNFDGNSIEFAYSSVIPFRITQLSEKNTSDASAIRTLSMTYGFNTTKFTDNKGRVNTYQFNDFGNTVGVKDQQGYAAFYKYNDGIAVPELKGKVSAASKLQKSILNYLQNHSFELTGPWIEGFEAGATGSVAIDTVEKNYGKKSAKINNTNAVGAHLYSHPTLALTKGNTYNISGYVKTSGLGTTDGTGAFLRDGYQSAAGVYTYVYTPLVTGTAKIVQNVL